MIVYQQYSAVQTARRSDMLKPNEQQARLLRSHHRRHGKNQYPDHAVFAQSIHQATHSMSQSYLFVFGFRAHDGCSYSQDSHTVSSFRAIGLVCGPFLRRREETSEMKDGWLAGFRSSCSFIRGCFYRYRQKKQMKRLYRVVSQQSWKINSA